MSLSAEQRKELIETAAHVRRWAYAPYSNYVVGAALLTESGKIYDGINIENAAYPDGTCAERVAIFKAVSEGERKFDTIAIVTDNGGFPCGSCRQVMAEFGKNALVLIANLEGELLAEYTVAQLLPDAFGEDDLEEPRK